MRKLAQRVVAFLLVAGGLWGQQSATVAESDAYRVEFLETVQVSENRGDIRHDFAVTPKTGAEPFRISTNRTWKFYSLEFAGRLLLVHGALDSAALTTTIVDLDRRETMDSFLHWGVEASPDGRYLALILHYPRMGALESRSAVLSIYDLTLSPEENRLKPMSEDAFDRSQQAGIPVYPLENVKPPTYAIWIPSPSDVHFIRDIGWLSSQHLIFLDGVEASDRIVTVDVTKGPALARAAVGDIPEQVQQSLNPDWKKAIDFANADVVSLRLWDCPECPERRVAVPLKPLAEYKRPTP